MTSPIIGKWQQPEGQPFAGLWFLFAEDGTFHANYAEMGIDSYGTYTASDGVIDMDQTRHTLGLIGKFSGRYAIEGDTLSMNLSDTGESRPETLEGKNRRLYKRILDDLK
jgi:hypothetical protein